MNGWTRWKRLLAVMLCALLCTGMLTGTAVGAEGATPETPEGTTLQAATDAPTPTAVPAVEPKAEPTASPAAEAEPTDSAPATASQSPAPETADPTATTDAPVTDTPPVCEIPDCPHVTEDAEGHWTAVCPLGEWMLAHGEPTATPSETPAGISLLDATEPGDVVLGSGLTTLYRSGSYKISGGTATSRIVVANQLAVAITLDGVVLDSLTLGSGVSLQVGTLGRNVIGTLEPNDGEIVFTGNGCLTVGTVEAPENATMTMEGGSLLMPDGVVSSNGNRSYHFEAAGATSATVDGTSYPFTTPDSADQAYLWLPAASAGFSYRSTVTDGVLTVLSTPEDPGAAIDFDMDGTAELTVEANKSYNIISSGGAPLAHTLLVNQSGVTMSFQNVDFSTTADVTVSGAARLHVNGNVALKSVTADADVSLTGSGLLKIGAMDVDTLHCVNTVRVCFDSSASPFYASWQTLVSPVSLDSITALSYQGRRYAFAYRSGAATTLYAPLPVPASGMRYDLDRDGDTLVATQYPTGTQTLVLEGSGLHIDANGNYVIITHGDTTASMTIGAGLNVTLLLRSARTAGSLTVGAGTTLGLTLEGSNRLDGGVTLGSGDSISVSGKGALTSGDVTALGSSSIRVNTTTNWTLLSSSVLGNSTLKPTVINVSGSDGLPVGGTAITLKLGTAKPFATTTAANGHVTLWGSKKLTNRSVVVLSSANTYADILTSDPANPDALPEISEVAVRGASYVTFTATNAQTAGIQYYINRPGAQMPDTFDAAAGRVARVYGECNIPGLRKGDVVTFRAYAARGAAQTLTADTADGFQFSDPVTFTAGDVRKVYTLAAQKKEYDMYAFKFAAGLIPKGASVIFFKNGVELSSAPTEIGEYTATVAIPAGHAEYQPTVVSVRVTIHRKIVWIYPDMAMKTKGEPDPPFSYTYSAMFGEDTVTGPLFREKGELYGNYPYDTRGLVAPDIYELRIDPASPMFFIDWGPGHYIKVDPLSIIDPVHQVLEYSDGTKLDLVLRTADRLTISKTTYGPLVTDPDDREQRPFTPQLRLKRGYDEAMIIIEAEPEINDDGGYQTDADGHIQLGSRTLTMTSFHLNRFKNQRITTLGFQLQDTMFLVDLADLTAEPVQEALSQAGLSAAGSRYQITLQPVNSANDLASLSEQAQEDKALGATMMNVRVEARSGDQIIDLSPYLPSARTAFDASALLAQTSAAASDVQETVVSGTSVQAVPTATPAPEELTQQLAQERLQALGARLNYYSGKSETLDSQLVVPYTASEADTLPYTAVMSTSPYLLARHERNGLYGLSALARP